MKISFPFLLWNLFTSFPTAAAFLSIHTPPSSSTSTTGSSTSTSSSTCLGMSTSQPSTSPMDDAKKLISKAISIGAPAYNAGDIQECARVYKTTAMEISSIMLNNSNSNNLNILPPSLKNGLEQAIQTEYDNDNEQAWAFRTQFDGIMEYQIPFMPETTTTTTTTSTELTFEKFTDGMMLPPKPLVVNDNVMGGISQCQWDESNQIFKGNTSLANNGGFASLRWRMSTVQNWSYAKGIYLKIKHSTINGNDDGHGRTNDGTCINTNGNGNPEHTFRLIVKDVTCGQVRGANFKNVFANPSQSEEPILIPFEAFDQMEQMGRALMGPVLNRGAVTELGLMAIKPTVVGEFELKIEEWGLYV